MAKRSAAEAGLGNVEFFSSAFPKRLALDDSTFDVILFLDVLEHLEARQEALAELVRLLRPSGLMLISLPNVDTTWKRRFKAAGLPYFSDPDHKIEYTSQPMEEEITSAGLVLDGPPQPVVHDTPFAGWVNLVGGVSLSLRAAMGKEAASCPETSRRKHRIQSDLPEGGNDRKCPLVSVLMAVYNGERFLR
jgi:SAM-dependent methyltransferase